ncbi:MAG: acyl carrier protein [Epsilonproteobacteria bacterium]|nr:acyl carrier protein [Campylobacterota bacterium]
MSLKEDLKEMIVRECDKNINPQDIKDSDILFDPNHPLELDSLDSLQISMALQNEYGLRVTDPKEARRIMKSINTLAEYIESNR